MKLRRFLPWWLLVVPIFLAVIWMTRVSIVSQILEFAAGKSEIENLLFSLESINTTSASFSGIQFDLVSGESRYHVTASDIQLSYMIDQLIDGRLRSVDINELTLNRIATEITTPDAIDVSRVVSVVGGMMTFDFPIESLAIKELHFVDDRQPAPSEAFEIVLRTNGGQAELEILQGGYSWIANKSADAVTTLLSSPDSTNILNGELNLVRDNNSEIHRFGGILSVDLERMAQWISLDGAENLIDSKGITEIDFGAEKIGDIWRTTSHGNLTDFIWSDFSMGNVKFALIAELPNQVSAENFFIQILDSSEISIDTINATSFTADDIVIQPHMRITRKGTDFSLSTSADSMQVFVGKLTMENNGLSQIQYRPEINIQTDKNEINASLKGEGSVGNGKIDGHAFTLERFEITEPLAIQQPFSGSLSEQQQWAITAGKLRLDNVTYQGNELDAVCEVIEIAIDDITPLSNQISANATAVEFALAGTSISLDSAQLQLSRNNESLQAQGTVVPTLIPEKVDFKFETALSAKHGIFELHQPTPVDLYEISGDISAILSEWAPGLTVNTGELQLLVKGDWDENSPMKVNIAVNLTDASGIYDGIIFDGFNFMGPVDIPLKSSEDILKSDSATINIDSLEYGAILEDIKSELNFISPENGNIPALNVWHLQGSLLASRFSAEDFVFDPNSDENYFEVSLNGLDLGKVVELQDIEGLEVIGKIDGLIPIHITGNELSIELGEFWNQGNGGKIRYKLDPAQAEYLTNSLTETVILALEDFNYDVLTGTAKYDSSGNLLVNFHIEGTSPGIANNQPVHLNINTEQNVLSLLESLRYAEGITDELDDKIKKSYQSNSGSGEKE